MISRNIAFKRDKPLKKSYVKRVQLFDSKTIHLRDDEPGDEPGSWFFRFVTVSFFHRKNVLFSVFASCKVHVFLINIMFIRIYRLRFSQKISI